MFGKDLMPRTVWEKEKAAAPARRLVCGFPSYCRARVLFSWLRRVGCQR